jgi:hypothetical protein
MSSEATVRIRLSAMSEELAEEAALALMQMVGAMDPPVILDVRPPRKGRSGKVWVVYGRMRLALRRPDFTLMFEESGRL